MSADPRKSLVQGRDNGLSSDEEDELAPAAADPPPVRSAKSRQSQFKKMRSHGYSQRHIAEGDDVAMELDIKAQDAAAVKIQAVERGKQARQKLVKLKGTGTGRASVIGRTEKEAQLAELEGEAADAEMKAYMAKGKAHVDICKLQSLDAAEHEIDEKAKDIQIADETIEAAVLTLQAIQRARQAHDKVEKLKEKHKSKEKIEAAKDKAFCVDDEVDTARRKLEQTQRMFAADEELRKLQMEGADPADIAMAEAKLKEAQDSVHNHTVALKRMTAQNLQPVVARLSVTRASIKAAPNDKDRKDEQARDAAQQKSVCDACTLQ